ncbi:MAG: arsenate reductase family protein [Coriobacteriales bacterium]|nr:arsenate reductase family protein [Coriobacteriales bacterium]
MNIQIFGTKKCQDTRKAERFFKERRIKYQYIDLAEKGLSKGELQSVIQSVGGISALINEKAHDQDTLALLKYTPEAMKFDKLLENQQLLRTPIVRNAKKATVGNAPDTWKAWIEEG